MIELDRFSRFKFTQATLFNDRETLDVWTQPSWLQRRPAAEFIETFLVTTATEGRPDKIANLLYGTPLLDWVLIAFNRADPLRWPKTGQLIEYPVESIVLPELI